MRWWESSARKMSFLPVATQARRKRQWPALKSWASSTTTWSNTCTVDGFLEHHKTAVAQGLYRDLEPIPGAPEAMRKIAAAGAHIRVVTHRLIFGGSHAKMVSDTAAWLDRMDIPYMSLCFTA